MYAAVEALQADLDAFMDLYHTHRPHPGRWCYGKTPMQTLLDSLDLAKAKHIAGLTDRQIVSELSQSIPSLRAQRHEMSWLIAPFGGPPDGPSAGPQLRLRCDSIPACDSKPSGSRGVFFRGDPWYSSVSSVPPWRPLVFLRVFRASVATLVFLRALRALRGYSVLSGKIDLST